ncbi:MAG: glucosaminidase [Rhodospirillaceae bacterium]|nr:glucosaminidase [Rhodospirillaceae bacterium]MBT6404117.1 glucosaminidase [Rhodospirillaceae bacterium]MBT6536439.1 glucosaminidase [Rhodospirillaceae bacterium]MBT6883095.1 glucosaminidase [Rhodospirillaceae bacterium]
MKPYLAGIGNYIPAFAKRRYFIIGVFVLLVGAVLWFAVGPAGGSTVRIKSPAQLHTYFTDQGYTMQALQAGNARVPPVFITSVPDDWADGLDVKQKKSLFFRTLLPLVLQVNREILADRARLAGLRKRLTGGETLPAADRKWLFNLAANYGVIDREKTDAKTPLSRAQIATLYARVDVVPPSLALAQGAIESAYALSRFAVEGNALFGQWRYGKGLKPEDQREALGDYRIASFKTPFDSVHGYAQNLNSNPAYQAFRQLRSNARKAGATPRGLTLVKGLISYSERREAYIDEVRALINFNKLAATDTALLTDAEPIELRAGLF